jgi:hypothetical protein
MATATNISISGTVDSYAAENETIYALKLDSLDSIPSDYASGISNGEVELYNSSEGTKFDFSKHIGKRVVVTVSRFFPTRGGLGVYVSGIENNSGDTSPMPPQTPSKSVNTSIEEANTVLSTLNNLGDLNDWLISDQSMIERAMIHWCSGESVPASVIEENLHRYFGVESIDHSYFAAKDGGFGYFDGRYSYGVKRKLGNFF